MLVPLGVVAGSPIGGDAYTLIHEADFTSGVTSYSISSSVMAPVSGQYISYEIHFIDWRWNSFSSGYHYMQVLGGVDHLGASFGVYRTSGGSGLYYDTSNDITTASLPIDKVPFSTQLAWSASAGQSSSTVIRLHGLNNGNVSSSYMGTTENVQQLASQAMRSEGNNVFAPYSSTTSLPAAVGYAIQLSSTVGASLTGKLRVYGLSR